MRPASDQIRKRSGDKGIINKRQSCNCLNTERMSHPRQCGASGLAVASQTPGGLSGLRDCWAGGSLLRDFTARKPALERGCITSSPAWSHTLSRLAWLVLPLPFTKPGHAVLSVQAQTGHPGPPRHQRLPSLPPLVRRQRRLPRGPGHLGPAAAQPCGPGSPALFL